jgi:probable O-glycosylation ligase (exosortase A-associated)
LRDILVFTIVLASLPFIIFVGPHIGALMWVWISMMNPHRLAYGFAHSFPFAMIIAIATLVSMVFSKQRKNLPMTPVTLLMFALVVWMSITSLFALQPPDVVYVSWSQVMKTQLMLFVTMMVIRGRKQIDQLIWVIVISVGFYGVKGGIWTLTSGGVNRVWGPPGSFIEGNNELGLALAMLIPLMYYLAQTASKKWIKYGMWAAIAACAFSILGSHSRGAFLAIGVAALFLGIKSGRPIVITLGLVLALAGAATLMPDNWIDRMGTIETYRSDASAVSRLQTWETIWIMVTSRPIVGAGFDLANPQMYQTYSPYPDMEAFAPHSIYFQVLGEHGFVGLALFLALGLAIWRRSKKLALACTNLPGLEWVPLLMRMVQVSLVAFAAGGAFLGLLHYDLPYYLAAIVVLAEVAVADKQSEKTRRQPARVSPSAGARSV